MTLMGGAAASETLIGGYIRTIGGAAPPKTAWRERWREVRGVWRQEAQRHPKLHLIGRLMEKECEGRGMMVKSKMRRRRLVKLRGEQQSWQFKLEDGGG